MDWVDEEARVPSERFSSREGWRDPRGEARPSRKGLEERFEHWMTRGRELVDGVSGTRPGTRALGRWPERAGSGQGGLDGLGRWVEGRLDWLLDDREDWREPWQEGDRPAAEPSPASPPPPPRSRVPLEAISRRKPAATAWAGSPDPAAPMPPVQTNAPADAAATDPSRDAWPEEDTYSVPRWRREEAPLPRPANPLTNPAPVAPPGRPLPRSTRRRQGA